MKNYLLLAALLLSFCLLFARSFAQQSDIQNINDDVEKLKKNISLLKNQLKEQEAVIERQTQKSDSIISALQKEAGKIEKTAESQSGIVASIENLKERSKKVGLAFVWRKKLAIIAVICLVAGFVVFLFLLIKKLNTLKYLAKKNEEDIISAHSLMNEQMSREVAGLNDMLKKNSDSFRIAVSDLRNEISVRIDKMTEESFGRIIKVKDELIQQMESRISATETSFKQMLLQQDTAYNEKYEGVKSAAESGNSALKSDLNAAKNQLAESIADARTLFVQQIQSSEDSYNEKNKMLAVDFAARLTEIEKNNHKKMAGLKDELMAVINDGLRELTDMIQNPDTSEKKTKKK
jgi:hypothetical protein